MNLLNSNKRLARTGSAVVELAVCLPIVMLLVWGTIELNNSIFVKQTLTSAAHEGALVGTGKSEEADIRSRVESVLELRLDVPYTLEIQTESGTTFDDANPGEIFTVVVTANPKSFSDAIDIGSVDARVSAIKQQ